MIRIKKFVFKMVLVILLLPLSLFSQVDRSKAPKPGPAPDFQLGEYIPFQLGNGLKVFIVENHKLPRVAFKLVLEVDPVLEEDKAGYVSAAGQLLRTGTKTRSKTQIDRTIDLIGAELSTSPTGIFALCLKEHSDVLAELLSDILLNASFKQEELDKIKLRMKSDLEASKDDPEEIARVVGNALVFGKKHPYGEPVTLKTVENIILEDCREYYKKFFRPNAAYLAVIGDINLDEAKTLVNKYFGAWEKKDVPEFEYSDPQAPDSNRVAIVDRPNSVQSIINIVYPVELTPSDEDVINALVTNTILGGGVFRLFKNLREKHGYTYGAYSLLKKDKLVGSFNAYANVRNEVTDSAVIQILHEMKRIREEKVSEEELQEAKNYLTGNFSMQLEDPETIADFAINIERYNLPKDYCKNYLKNLNNINSDQVQEAAKKFIKPDNAIILVVGKAASVEQKLKAAAGTVQVNYYNQFGTEINKISNLPLGLTAEKIIESYIDSIGGRENMLKITDRTTILKGTLFPAKIEMKMNIYQKAPNLMMQKTEVGGIVKKVIFDGKNGYSITGDVKTEIKDEDLERLKFESTLTLLLDLDVYDVKVNLLGSEEINDRKTYKIEMVLPSGAKWIQFYDAETCLKVKEEKPFKAPNGVFTQEIIYDDYRKVNGVKYPFTIQQSVGRQKFIFNADSIKVNTGLSERNFME
jgi:predicted Zn-dependent peptidase